MRKGFSIENPFFRKKIIRYFDFKQNICLFTPDLITHFALVKEISKSNTLNYSRLYYR
jgi:hypothetical protein